MKFVRISRKPLLSLLTMCMEDAPATQAQDREALSKQRQAKQQKEELMLEKGLTTAQELYIDALYYHEMFHSPACWKKATDVNRGLRKLTSKSAKLEAVKENIRMRVVGLGWDDCRTAWSKNGKEYTPDELAQHLKNIIRDTRNRKIPKNAPVVLPMRKELPVLGTQTSDVVAIDAARLATSDEFEANARRIRDDREANGIGDSCGNKQPMSAPNVDDELIGKRLEVCVEYELLNEIGTELRWCPGEVTLVSDGTNIVKPDSVTGRAFYKKGEAVMMRWEANEKCNEPETESSQKLAKNKWNPRGQHTADSWRFCLD